MRRLLLALGILSLVAAPAAAQRWSNVAAAPVVVDSLGRVVANGRNLSILYTGFEANLQRPGDSLSEVRVQSFQASIDNLSASRWVQLAQDVRGHVTKGADSRVVVVISAGGAVVTRVFPYGQAHQGDFTVRMPARVRWNPGQRYVATFMVVAERRTPNAAVQAGIDSFDATVDPAAAPARR